MKDEAKLLDGKLLENRKELEIIDYLLKVLNRPQGWHYDLDIIWILKELEANNVKKGATILDAGAGLGITQFILAYLGYNVISLDFSDRKLPFFTKRLFDIEIVDNAAFNYEHEYMNFVKYNAEQRINKIDVVNSYSFSTKLKNIVINQIYNFRNWFYYLNEIMKTSSNYGKITFIRDAFHNIHLEDNSVDAVISVSAIEHADKKLLKENLDEFRRVVKSNGPILISTSANSDLLNDTYHRKTKGICFSKKSISDFGVNLKFENYDYESVQKGLLENKIFMSRIDRYYIQDPLSDFYKRYIKEFPYLPVGVKIFKN
jgi:ubiquinone/menaquinone biosynthesis C-methylase UbiE